MLFVVVMVFALVLPILMPFLAPVFVIMAGVLLVLYLSQRAEK